MLYLLALLPLATYALTAVAARPASTVVAPVRLALLRAAVLVGAYAVVGLTVLPRITLTWLLLLWGLGLLAAAGAAWRRGKPALTRPRLDRTDLLLLAALALLALGTLVLSLAYPPNNFDSQAYHLPKVERWVQQGNLDFFATRIHRQVTYAPGAEYLLLHLRVLTGGDRLLNLLQWAAALGCAVAASRIAAQFGGGRRAQLLAALVVASTPLVLLEASSTQTDLVVALWVGITATVVLDRSLAGAPLLGLLAGLIALTKLTGLFGAAPLLVLWGLAHLRRRPGRTVLATGVVVLAALLVCGPFFYRMYHEFASILGPEYVGDSVSMRKHDPASLLVNALRMLQSLLDTPVGPLSRGFAAAVRTLAGWLGVDPTDPAISFGPPFPQITWYPDEDRAAYPVQALLVLAGLAAYLIKKSTVRTYALAVTASVLLHVTMIKWQMWGTRLTLFLLVLGAPLAGLLLAALWRRRAPVAAALVALALVPGVASVAYGWPRRLLGPDSMLTLDDGQKRFARRPAWEADFQWGADRMRAVGARRIGLAESNDSWEYPWWVLLKGRRILALQSQFPAHPPATAADVDAILCVNLDEGTCSYYLSPGWHQERHGTVAVLLPD